MDGAYWEQLMYVGDTRLQALCNFVMTTDDRLTRKALRLFDDSRLPSGLTQSRFPCGNGQVIPPFSLYWISMLHDFARWRGDADLVRELLPGVRSVLHAHVQHRRADGLVAACSGWNFVDWVPGWRSGEPPGTADGLSSSLMWQLVCALQEAAALEAYTGQNRLATNWRAEAKSLAAAVMTTFWDAERGLMADDRAHSSFSEHAQCFALASGRLGRKASARVLDQLDRGEATSVATIYFSHYVLAALAAGGRAEGFFRRLELWKALPDQGFRTPYEAPGNTRSDCHAWASHPLYHQFASICGIQPADFGFRTVVIRPLLGPLRRVDAVLVHPRGRIRLAARVDEQGAHFDIRLPAGVTGHLYWAGRCHALRAGRQVVSP
jgi:alpha-L-rhamnosidase